MPSDPQRLNRWAAGASVLVAIILAAAKLVAALVTGSAAILSSLVDSLADIAASGVTWFSVRIAAQPPDTRHRFGHGKAEALSALAQAALIAGSAAMVIVEAGQRLVVPVVIKSSTFGVAVMSASIMITLALLLFQQFVIKRTGSQAIIADRLHYQSDLATNIAVTISLLLARSLDISWVDAVVALGVANFLVVGSWRIGSDAIHTLMDHELSGEERDRIKALVLAHPEVKGLHDLRTREAAGTKFIEFHIELPGKMSIEAAHLVTDALEGKLATVFLDAEIIIHQEPEGLEDARLDHRLRRPI